MGKQVLDIEPKNEIYFRGPYSQTVTEYFKITNPTDRRIAFKVKTTAPKRYCVRPSNGVLSPNATESIAVILQPYEGGIRIDKSIHKFMIQSVYAPEGNFNHEDLFKSASPTEIMDSKFKCVFDDGPNTTGATAGVTNGDHGGAALGGGSGDDFATRTEPKVQRVTIKENQQGGVGAAAAARLSSMKVSTAGDDHTLPGYDTATAGSTLNEAHDEFVGDSAAATGGVYGEAVAKDLSHDDVKRLHDQIQRLKEKLKESEQQRSQHYVPSHLSSSSSQSQLDSNLYVQLIVVSIAIFVGILVGRLF